jgi:hypothetical protein
METSPLGTGILAWHLEHTELCDVASDTFIDEFDEEVRIATTFAGTCRRWCCGLEGASLTAPKPPPGLDRKWGLPGDVQPSQSHFWNDQAQGHLQHNHERRGRVSDRSKKQIHIHRRFGLKQR